jgi:hypothetical protein
MQITFTKTHIIVGTKRTRVSYAGPNCWVEGVDPATIKIRPWTGNHFGADVRKAFDIENNSDAMTDYFEGDSIRLLPGHPHYGAVKNAAEG